MRERNSSSTSRKESGSINEKHVISMLVKAKIPPDKPPKEIDISLSPRCAMQEMPADQRHS